MQLVAGYGVDKVECDSRGQDGGDLDSEAVRCFGSAPPCNGHGGKVVFSRTGNLFHPPRYNFRLFIFHISRHRLRA